MTGPGPLQRILCAALAAAALCALPVQAQPRRVMSLNLCTDILLLHLAERQHIASLSYVATNSPLSPIVQTAEGIPVNHASVEELLAVEPDLVLARRYTASRTVALARRMGFTVLELDDPRSLAEIEAQIRQLAAALGEQERGERLVAGMHARLAALPPVRGAPPQALVYGPNGYTFGAGSLLDDLLRQAGFDNLAARLGLGEAGTLSLEQVVLAQPAVLVFEREPGAVTTLSGRSQSHPVLRQLARQASTMDLSSRLWNCGGPEAVTAVEQLALLRQRHEMARSRP